MQRGGPNVADIFKSTPYTGTGDNQYIATGFPPDFVWGKRRNGTQGHYLIDSARGGSKLLQSNTTAADISLPSPYFTPDASGYATGPSDGGWNAAGGSFVSWAFRKARRFFDVRTISHTNGVATNIGLSDLGTIGLAVAKITNATGDWYAWHRSLTAGNNLRLNTTAAQSSASAYLSVSGATLTLSAAAPTGTYAIYAWAHDTASDGVIQGGSYTGNGSASGPTMTLGWKPQYIIIKRADIAGFGWYIFDQPRLNFDAVLEAGAPAKEAAVNGLDVTATGFKIVGTQTGWNAAGGSYVYVAIRAEDG